MAVGITLDEFRGAVKEVARPNRFLLSLSKSPSGIPGVEMTEDQQYLVRTAALPARGVGEITTIFWQGMNFKMAGDPTYENMPISFLNNASFSLKKMFETWLNGISNTKTNHRLKPDEYKAVIKVDQLSSSDSSVIATYYLHGAYPLSLDAVELGQETIDAVSEFTVQLSIDYWSDSDTSGEGEGVVNAVGAAAEQTA